jgi:hypothetical protein
MSIEEYKLTIESNEGKLNERITLIYRGNENITIHYCNPDITNTILVPRNFMEHFIELIR